VLFDHVTNDKNPNTSAVGSQPFLER